MSPGVHVAGIGDLTLIDLFVLPKGGDVTLVAGPVLVTPMASEDELGSGTRQAGCCGRRGRSTKLGSSGRPVTP